MSLPRLDLSDLRTVPVPQRLDNENPADLDALRERAMPMRDGFYHVVGYYRAFRREDFDSLIAEVERLRAFNSDLRLMVDGLETAAHEERAAVVAWLLASGTSCDNTVNAEAIERGEHRREEKP